jgi:hypothetical protein
VTLFHPDARLRYRAAGGPMRWLAVVLLAGCGGGDGGGGDDVGFPTACDESTIDGDCVDFTGSGWLAEDVTSNCTQGGDLLPECPPTSAVGTCTIDGGTEWETVTTFYSPFWSAASGVQACQGQGGAWVQAQ